VYNEVTTGHAHARAIHRRPGLIAAALGVLGGAVGGVMAVVGVEAPAAAGSYCAREVTFHIHAAGDDTVGICDETVSRFDRLRIARAVAVSVGVDPDDVYDDDYSYVATVPLHAHLPERDGPTWRFDYDTDALQSELAAAGYPAFTLRLCPPKPGVGVELEADPAPARITRSCATWFVTTEGNVVEFTLRLRPDEDDYWGPIAVAGAITALLTLVALAAGWLLRRGALRHRTGRSFLVAAAALYVGVVSGAALAALLFASGATSELVLDNDLRVGFHFLAALGPGAVAITPFLLFAGIVLSAPGRPRVSDTAPAASAAGGPRASW
jgi:hypothetical protein